MRLGENNVRYFRWISIWWKCIRVDGLRTMADLRTRAGRMRRVHQPAIIRSETRRFGARLRPRFRISSWCRTNIDSATTDRKPPGLESRTKVTITCTKRTRMSRTRRWYQSLTTPQNLGGFSNSPQTGSSSCVNLLRLPIKHPAGTRFDVLQRLSP